MSLNGGLAATDLAKAGGVLVAAEVAADLQCLVDDFARHFGRPLRITGGYRSLEQQDSLFRSRYQTRKIEGALTARYMGRTWYKLPGVATAAVPGTSKHGWGLAVDLNSSDVNSTAEREWLKSHGHGWCWPAWAQTSKTYEPWHYEHAAPVAESEDVMAQLPHLNWTRTAKTASGDTRTVQALLQARGYYLGSRVDGIRGLKSIAALASFQVATNSGNGHGGADKMIGDRTWQSLLFGTVWS